ncbi:MAG: DUF3786 domain-containing protein [Candidatus Bathyarchaeota archaeon]|nr:DUF3786 domain-containing protein [Candidatus Bathyarchaeota archaeon]
MAKINLAADIAEKLEQLLGASYDFLGFTLKLKSATITDNLQSTNIAELHYRLIAPMLSHYAIGKHTPLTGKLLKFKDIPGGYAYEDAFINRAIKPIEDVFGEDPKELLDAAGRLGGKPLAFGDASAEINTLKGIPLTYILYEADEFPASASILYDSSASDYLPTEDLAVLGEFASMRLIEAKR